jgi:tRNA A37 methylthiotransferase MiaB
MKLAFVNIPLQNLDFPPAAASLLTAIVEKRLGWDTKVFDFNMFLNSSVDTDAWIELENYWRSTKEDISNDTRSKLEATIERFAEQLQDYNPDWLAISVFSRWSTIACYEVVKILRKKLKCKIFIGGHGIDSWPGSLPGRDDTKKYTTIASYLKDQHLIDHYVTGEGEDSIVELLGGHTEFPGIDGKMPRPVKSLNDLPAPNYRDVNPNDYYYTTAPGVYITASKGCVRKCTFCNVPDLWPVYTLRDTDSLVSEFKMNVDQYGVKYHMFTDELCNGSMKHWRAFNKGIVDLKQKDPKYEGIQYRGFMICRSRKEQDEKDWELMAKAGASLFMVGFESYSPTVRAHMGKHNYSNDDIDFHLEQSGRYGIKNIALFFTGYPTETLEDFEMNKEFLYKHLKYAKSGIVHMIRWGYTGMFRDPAKVEAKKDVEMIIDPDFESKFKNLPWGIRDIALGVGWINKSNPTLTLKERIRRRLEMHELCVKLGWPQTRSRDELTILYNIMKNLEQNIIDPKDLTDLDNTIDLH